MLDPGSFFVIAVLEVVILALQAAGVFYTLNKIKFTVFPFIFRKASS